MPLILRPILILYNTKYRKGRKRKMLNKPSHTVMPDFENVKMYI